MKKALVIGGCVGLACVAVIVAVVLTLGNGRGDVLILCDEQFSPSVCCRDWCEEFKGICEEIDDIYVIRLAVDWIEMTSIENDDLTIKKGDAISFSLCYDCIGIYPY